EVVSGGDVRKVWQYIPGGLKTNAGRLLSAQRQGETTGLISERRRGFLGTALEHLHKAGVICREIGPPRRRVVVRGRAVWHRRHQNVSERATVRVEHAAVQFSSRGSRFRNALTAAALVRRV